MNIEFEFKGKKVTYNNDRHEKTTVSGFPLSDIAKIDNNLAEEIKREIQRKKQDIEAEDQIKLMEQHKKFVVEITKLIPVGYSVSFSNPKKEEIINYIENPKTGEEEEVVEGFNYTYNKNCMAKFEITKDGVDSYHNKAGFDMKGVWSGWHQGRVSGTKVPWCASYNYKDQRYAKVETAITKTIERIEAKLDEDTAKNKAKVKAEARLNMLKNNGSIMGWKVTDTWKKGPEAECIIQRNKGEEDWNCPKAKAYIKEEDVTGVSLGGKYTYEQFNELIALARKFQTENRGKEE